MEPTTYNEQEIAEHYIGIIKSKREQGFTDEQIAKDIGFPLETVQRVNTNDTLPENPNEKEDDELPIQNNNRTTDRDSSDKKIDNIPEGGTYKPGINAKEDEEHAKSVKTSQNENKYEDLGTTYENKVKEDIKKASQNEKLDVKEEYTLEQSAKDMFSDDGFKQLKAEFAQAKIRHSKLVHHIAKVMISEEEDYMPVEMLQIKADAMQVYLTCLGVQMNMVKRIEKEIKNEEEK